jgi:SOS-response transcriptional repressor LexA
VLEYIKTHIKEHGMSPTIREIGDALGVSGPTVHQHAHALIEKGLLDSPPNKARGLVPADLVIIDRAEHERLVALEKRINGVA